MDAARAHEIIAPVLATSVNGGGTWTCGGCKAVLGSGGHTCWQLNALWEQWQRIEAPGPALWETA